MQIEFEFTDGSHQRYTVDDNETAWKLVHYTEQRAQILSAWRDQEPWFGQCTDFTEGTP